MSRFYHIIAIAICLLMLGSCSNSKDSDIKSRVDDLLEKMTFEEKIGQLCCPIGFTLYNKVNDSTVVVSDDFKAMMDTMPRGSFWAVLRADPWSEKTLETGLNPRLSALLFNEMQRYAVEETRLGIPLLFAEECVHGHFAIGATVFPTGIGQASTWDEELLKKMGAAVALEARLQGAHYVYGPVMDITRDPRWSRVEESFGEDPYLSGVLGTAVMQGMQQHAMSTLKHFAAYGTPLGGHNGASMEVGKNHLLTDYTSNFEYAVKNGAKSIMTSYNAIDGTPCTSNCWLLNDLLREQWNFNGIVFSDLGSIWALHSTHRVAGDQAEAAAMALKAGVDIDLGGSNYGGYLREAWKRGLIDIQDVDNAVRRVLTVKFEAGLFENPYINPDEAEEVVGNEEHRELARQVARESIVLLKNDGVLPLSKDIKNIAVIGPNADNIYNQLGDYTAPQNPDFVVTLLEGVHQVADKANLLYQKGCNVRDTTQTTINEALNAALKSDAVILAVGGSSARDFKTSYEKTGAALVNQYLSDMDCGEGYDRASLDLLGDQEKLMRALASTGKPLIIVYIGGRPLLKNLASEVGNAVLTSWYPGEQGGNAIADVIFGDYNPAGRLPITVPRSVGQLPIYYSMPPQNNYADMTSAPLYALGFGLSYSTFEYNNLYIKQINKPKTEYDENNIILEVSCNVTNTGDYDGDEVIQLYVRDEVASTTPPEKLLKGFKRIYINKGVTKTMTFQLTERDLSVLDENLSRHVESGEFTIMIGASSNDIRLKEKITI